MITIHVGLLIAVVMWMMSVTATQAVAAWQLWRIMSNHLPGIEKEIKELSSKLKGKN